MVLARWRRELRLDQSRRQLCSTMNVHPVFMLQPARFVELVDEFAAWLLTVDAQPVPPKIAYPGGALRGYTGPGRCRVLGLLGQHACGGLAEQDETACTSHARSVRTPEEVPLNFALKLLSILLPELVLPSAMNTLKC